MVARETTEGRAMAMETTGTICECQCGCRRDTGLDEWTAQQIREGREDGLVFCESCCGRGHRDAQRGIIYG
jgi:hypothetical protein